MDVVLNKTEKWRNIIQNRINRILKKVLKLNTGEKLRGKWLKTDASFY